MSVTPTPTPDAAPAVKGSLEAFRVFVKGKLPNVDLTKVQIPEQLKTKKAGIAAVAGFATIAAGVFVATNKNASKAVSNAWTSFKAKVGKAYNAVAKVVSENSEEIAIATAVTAAAVVVGVVKSRGNKNEIKSKPVTNDMPEDVRNHNMLHNLFVMKSFEKEVNAKAAKLTQ